MKRLLIDEGKRTVAVSQRVNRSTKVPKPSQKVFGTSGQPSLNKQAGTNR